MTPLPVAARRRTRRPEPAEAAALRAELAEVIRDALSASSPAEAAGLVKRRNAIGRRLAAVLKSAKRDERT